MIKSFIPADASYVNLMDITLRGRFKNVVNDVRREDIYFPKKQDDVSHINVFREVPSW